jgi:membrane protein YdbS with pleckstrin-like domain
MYPSLETILAQPDRSRLLEVKRSLRSILPLIFSFIVSAILVFLLIDWLENRPWLEQLPVIKHISPRWLGFVPAIFLLEILRRRHDDLYTFAENRIMHRAGRLSLNYRIPSVHYTDIRSVRVVQSIWGRILGYGNVELGTAAQDGVELTLEGILDPQQIADLLDGLRAHTESAMRAVVSGD